MEHREAEKHQAGYGEVADPVDPKGVWGEEVQDVVERRAEETRRERQWVM